MPIEPKAVYAGERFLIVDFRAPAQFEQIRTPDWAQRVADSSAPGTLVRMGMTKAGNWMVQSVLVPVELTDDPAEAAMVANAIQDRIEREGEYLPIYKQTVTGVG